MIGYGTGRGEDGACCAHNGIVRHYTPKRRLSYAEQPVNHPLITR